MTVVHHIIMSIVDTPWIIVNIITEQLQKNNPMDHTLSLYNDEYNITPLYLLINICSTVKQIYKIECELSMGYLIPLFVGNN